MTFIITVLFPNDPDATYNIDYYAIHHMPLIQEQWAKYGITGWNVRKFAPGPDGAEPNYAFGSDILWESKDKVEDAFKGPEAAGSMADEALFSNKAPVFLYGEVVGAV